MRLVAGLLCAALLAPAVPAQAEEVMLVVPAASATLPPTWREVFHVGYGRKEALLGTSRGGDSGTLRLGPEYGAPAPDGSWWFLDAAKKRFAHYSRTGRYLGGVRVPRRLLVQGVYFQWQLPHVLANGTLVAVRQAPSGPRLLRVRHGRLSEVAVSTRLFYPTWDDGRRLYGFAGRRLVKVNARTGRATRVDSLRTPSGARVNLDVDFDAGTVQVGSAVLSTRTGSGAVAHVGVQARAGADDVVHLFLAGYGDDDESAQLVGYTSVGPDGTVGRVAALPDPYSEADPGSPAQLAIAAGSSTPQLVYVLPDGVHVYARG